MRISIIIITLFACPLMSSAQTGILYGKFHRDSLSASPYISWYKPNYHDYKPESETISRLKKTDTKDITIEVFLGTWCGDSKREVPRFMKIMDDMGFPQSKITLVGLGASDSLYKQSPGQEEKGKGIFRVPVFIVYQKGIEINRITEFPATSLEKDLSVIFNRGDYKTNYRSFNTIQSWLVNGDLSDPNTSPRGLAAILKSLVSNENELNSLGYLFLNNKWNAEAIKLFHINAILYPESSNVVSSLGEGYLKNGDLKNSIIILERALELNKDPKMVKEILLLLYEAVK